jgi:hypothetical protein
MLNTFLSTQSLVGIFLIFLIVPCLIVLVAYFLFKKIRPTEDISDDDKTFLTGTLSGLITLACILIGFGYSIAIGHLDKVDADLVVEVTNIQTLNRLLSIDASPESLRAKNYLDQYALSIVDDEWPELAKGGSSIKTGMLWREVEKSLDSLNLKTQKQISIFSSIIMTAEQVKTSRLTRLLNASLSIPSTFVRMSNLLILLIFVISGILMVHASNLRKFALLLQSLIFALFLAGVVVLDFPYTGAMKVSPEAMKAVLNLL